MRTDNRNARWEPWNLIAAAGAGKHEYTCVPKCTITNPEQLEMVNVSTMLLLAIMSPFYEPPKVKK